jgi:hypothetical protein
MGYRISHEGMPQSVWENAVRIGMVRMRFYKRIAPIKHENRLLTNGKLPIF